MHTRQLRKTGHLKSLWVGAFCLLLASAANAQIGFGNWWQFIHCHGQGVNHSAGTPVDDAEEFDRDGFEYEQCHGSNGETGTCMVDGLSQGVFGKVTCTNVTIFGTTTSRCIAQATCTNGQTLYCVGTNGQAFAGIETNSNGGKTLFVLCRNGGQHSGSGHCSI